MAKNSNSEKGHAKNAANFEDLLVRYKALGARYNPSRPELQFSYLQQVFSEARMALDQLIDAQTAESNAINNRKNVFKHLLPFVTRVINALAAHGTNKSTMEDARGIKRKLDGKRASKKEKSNGDATTTETTTATSETATENGTSTQVKEKSTSQRSYDLQVEHVARLVSLIQSLPNYQPNEPELQLAALQNLLQELRHANTMVTIAQANAEAARRNRYKVFYDETNGLVPLALQSKLYIKSIFGATSEEYKQISRISFRMIRS
ncbi:MAG: hypothetical protein IPJ74_00055 [Saprospiraceae bacterium]|nr:hypothetical protein [Saprospiraceae bacterium]